MKLIFKLSPFKECELCIHIRKYKELRALSGGVYNTRVCVQNLDLLSDMCPKYTRKKAKIL